MSDEAAAFRRTLRRLLAAWLALIGLMLTSLGSAYLPLGGLNVVAGLAIAALKAGIVVWLFMRLGSAGTMARIAAAVGFATWGLLVALSGVDYATRITDPAPMQPPQLLRPLQHGGSAR
jgi:cytochrome c oxidase subunit 4